MKKNAKESRGAGREPSQESDRQQYNTTQYVFDPHLNKYFRVWESRGEVKECDQGGQLLKPFNPNLTGRFPYNRRLAIMKQQFPEERQQDLVEPVNALKSNSKKNYSPQPNKLDGYSHMPNRNVLPYFNKKVQVQSDGVKFQHMKRTMNFFGEANRHLRLEEEYASGVRSPNYRKIDNKGLSNSVALRKDSTPEKITTNTKVIKSQSRNHIQNDLYANDSVDEIPV